jgi:tetratricopeptide (TPR) repeat protein
MDPMRKNPRDRPTRYRAAQLAISIALHLVAAAAGQEASYPDPLYITEEMKEWIDREVVLRHSDSQRADGLMAAIGSLDLRYEVGRTGTAAEVFATREFNCVSFSFLFVGLSRHLGLRTFFLRAIDNPGFTKEGELVVVSEHMTAGMKHGVHTRVLEFQLLPDPTINRFERLSDQQAVALYYSNLGAERLIAGEPESAASLFEEAVKKESGFPELWVNLGVARRRFGDFEGAEKAYLRALQVDPNDSRAYLNLASLMWRLGRPNATDRLLRLVARGNPQSPYAYLVLGDHAMRGKRLEDAERFFRRAIRKDRSSGEARAALGLLLLEKGETTKAAKQLTKAQKRDREHARTQRLARALAPSSGSEQPEDEDLR